jgi:hypothetical protein
MEDMHLGALEFLTYPYGFFVMCVKYEEIKPIFCHVRRIDYHLLLFVSLLHVLNICIVAYTE